MSQVANRASVKGDMQMDRKAEGNPNAVESWCHSAVSIRVRNPVSSAMARRPSRLLARHSK
jgi:hypothetical protein